MALAALIVAGCCAMPRVGPASSSRPSITAICGATLIDGTGRGPIKNSIVILSGSRIWRVGVIGKTRVPSGAHVIDGRGKFLLPGLIDCHVHLESVGLSDLEELPERYAAPERLRVLAAINASLDLLAGFTTLRDLGSTDVALRLRDDIRAGRQFGPRILAAGNQLVKHTPGAFTIPMFRSYDGPEDARDVVRRQVAAGVDVIKVRLTHSRTMPSPEEMAAIVQEAHRLQRRVAVHTDVPMDDGVKLAADAGVDSIEHNAPLRVKSQELLAELSRKKIAEMAGSGSLYVQRIANLEGRDPLDARSRRLLPSDIVTLLDQVAADLRKQTDDLRKSGWDSRQIMNRFVAETARARNANLPLVFGTDSGADLMVHGQQYRAMVGETHMGSTPMQVLLMATRDAARLLGLDKEIGTIERGRTADLVLLNGNPLADIGNVARVAAVFQGGKEVRP